MNECLYTLATSVNLYDLRASLMCCYQHKYIHCRLGQTQNTTQFRFIENQVNIDQKENSRNYKKFAMTQKCVWLLLLAVTWLTGLAQGQPQVHLSDLANVDRLIHRYLTLERALWQVIRSGVPQSTALRRIHDTHLTFFAEDFHVKNVFFDIDPDQRTLANALHYINATVASVDKSPLHANEKDYNQNEAIAFATNNIHMKENYDKVHNITEGNDFYGYIARVGLS